MLSSNAALYSNRGSANIRYNLNGTNLTFMPEPDSADSVTVWYVPSFVKLVNDADSVSNNIATNWEEYAVVLAALKMKSKEETSTVPLERELTRISARIEEASRNRDAGEPMGITDDGAGLTISYGDSFNWG